jgi:predicted HNH restriction endonuclease
MVKIKSPINYNYATIKITQSRINKSLIAIPVSLAKWFPKNNTQIQVYLDDSHVPHIKRYSSYSSTTRECRIGGMAEWFEEIKIKDGDEIVVQLIDKDRFIYRLIPEQKFLIKTHKLQSDLDKSKNDSDASDKIVSIAEWTEADKKSVMLNEYRRLIKTMPVRERRYNNRYSNKAKEDAPSNLRVILEGIYEGHCQVCDFWFLKMDNRPFFEIHHVNPLQGNHPQNLIVVCANCHRQFEYANVKTEINNGGWLIGVIFNNKLFKINQMR